MFLFTILFCSVLSAQKGWVTVRGLITYTSQYCGGARPPEELLKELATPKPYAEKVIFIKKGNQNPFTNKVLYRIKTDSLGRYSVKLKSGIYIIVDGLKENKKMYDSIVHKYAVKTSATGVIDTVCYKNFYETPDKIFKITSKMKSLNDTLNYFKGCNWSGSPCVPFTGFYPP